MIRFRKRISISTVMRFYRAFIRPHFHYCASVWHFCTSRNLDKLEALNKEAYPEIYSTRKRIAILLTFGGIVNIFVV